jgi:hypothetical protein
LRPQPHVGARPLQWNLTPPAEAGAPRVWRWDWKYGDKEAANDRVRLMEFTALRDNKTALTEAQKAEEAHLRARFDVFKASAPPSTAGRGTAVQKESIDWRFLRGVPLAQRLKRT